MNKKVFIGLFAGIAILGAIIGIVLNTKMSPWLSTTNITSIPSPRPSIETTTIKSEVTPTRAPTPTISLLSEVVKRIEGNRIIVESAKGEMTVPKDPNKVKVFKRVGGELEVVSFDDVIVGQKVTLKIIVPGKEAELIIEP